MIKDIIKTKQLKGFGPILLLALALFPPLPLIAVVWLIARLNKVKLTIAPNVLLFRKIDLGNIFAWGIFVFIMGTLLFLAGINNVKEGSTTLGITILICLPIMVSGNLMMFYHAKYMKYICAADTLLEQIRGGKDSFVTSEFTFIGPRNKPIKYNSITLHRLLLDMKENGIVDFSQIGSYYKISLYNSGAQAQYRPVVDKPIATWVCKYCGASNNTPSTCEYCGSNK